MTVYPSFASLLVRIRPTWFHSLTGNSASVNCKHIIGKSERPYMRKPMLEAVVSVGLQRG